VNDAMSLLGVGIYSVPEAARLTEVSANRIRRWLGGYDFKVKDGSVHKSPALWQGAIREGKELSLSFRDLIEVRFVDAFRKHGVSWEVLRLSAQRAAELFQVTHPFSAKRFRTDGKSIFADIVSESGEESLVDLFKNQYGFKKILDPYLYRGLEFSPSDDLLRWWPMGQKRKVVLDPARAFGQPIVSTGYIQTTVLASAYRAEESFERVANWFGTDARSVRDAVEFEGKLAA